MLGGIPELRMFWKLAEHSRGRRRTRILASAERRGILSARVGKDDISAA